MKLLAGMASGGPAWIRTAICEAASAMMVGATLMRAWGFCAGASVAKASVAVIAASAARARPFPLTAAAALRRHGAASCHSSDIAIPHSRRAAASLLFALRLAPLQELLEQALLLSRVGRCGASGLRAPELIVGGDV